MGGIQLARAACPEALNFRVGGSPDVEIADLGPLGGGDSDDGAGRGFPCLAGAWGKEDGLSLDPGCFADGGVG